jgi:hypothetical protein
MYMLGSETYTHLYENAYTVVIDTSPLLEGGKSILNLIFILCKSSRVKRRIKGDSSHCEKWNIFSNLNLI